MSRPGSRPTITAAAVAAAAAGWLALAAAPPVLHAAGWFRASAWTRLFFAPLCHQDPARCFHLLGWSMALCARCAGLYAGFAAGAIWILTRTARRGAIPSPPRSRALLIAAAPSAAQWVLAVSGWTADLPWARAATGSLLGFTVAAYFIYSVHRMRGELAAELRRVLAPGGRVDASTS